MRAAYANGVLAAFEDAGLAFDAVYGTSAGGALAAWWSAGQARFAAASWRYVADRRILSYRRWLLGRGPLLDHDALFDIVYAREHPLDIAALAKAPHPVVVTATDAETGETRYVDLRAGPVLAWLRATGRMPLASGPAVEIDGRRWVDGGVTDPIPIARAIADRHDRVVCVLNRPAGSRKPEPRFAVKLIARRYPALAPFVARHHENHARAVALAERPPAGVAVSIVRPATPLGLSRFTRDPDAVARALARGEADGRAWLATGAAQPSAEAARPRPGP